MALNTSKLLAVLKSGETETVEFKTSFDKETIETLSAFANTKGGTVFLGISDSRSVKGVVHAKETIQNWINQIKMSTSNTIIPDVEALDVDGKTVVALVIAEYPIKPVACKGRYYRRVKNANHQMTVSEVVNLHLQTCNTSWDYYLDDHHSEKDISLDKVQNFIDMANRVRSIPITDDPLTYKNTNCSAKEKSPAPPSSSLWLVNQASPPLNWAVSRPKPSSRTAAASEPICSRKSPG